MIIFPIEGGTKSYNSLERAGIGLYAAKEIIEKGHNRKVWVESEDDGKGSQFYVELPVVHVS